MNYSCFAKEGLLGCVVLVWLFVLRLFSVGRGFDPHRPTPCSLGRGVGSRLAISTGASTDRRVGKELLCLVLRACDYVDPWMPRPPGRVVGQRAGYIGWRLVHGFQKCCASRHGKPLQCTADGLRVRCAHCALGRSFPLFLLVSPARAGGHHSTVPGPGAVDVSGHLPWPHTSR